jgi:aminoglycoside phosphotransferase (APT) family kinase protein
VREWDDELGEADALRVVHERFPEFADLPVTPMHQGWDSYVFVAGEQWVIRVPRRASAERALRQEAELLAAIGPGLPTRVPVPVRICEPSPIAVLAPRIPGLPAADHPDTARQLGAFLKVLHDLPVESTPIPVAGIEEWRHAHARRRAEFEQAVFPLLELEERERAKAMFDGVTFDFRPVVVHGDLGPEHVLADPAGTVNGVIDWSDARSGDPAIDLAWPLNGMSEAFANGVLSTYGEVDSDVSARAAFYHRRSPWYEVLYGLQRQRDDLVASGLADIRSRLP